MWWRRAGGDAVYAGGTRCRATVTSSVGPSMVWTAAFPVCRCRSRTRPAGPTRTSCDEWAAMPVQHEWARPAATFADSSTGRVGADERARLISVTLLSDLLPHWHESLQIWPNSCPLWRLNAVISPDCPPSDYSLLYRDGAEVLRDMRFAACVAGSRTSAFTVADRSAHGLPTGTRADPSNRMRTSAWSGVSPGHRHHSR